MDEPRRNDQVEDRAREAAGGRQQENVREPAVRRQERARKYLTDREQSERWPIG